MSIIIIVIWLVALFLYVLYIYQRLKSFSNNKLIRINYKNKTTLSDEQLIAVATAIHLEKESSTLKKSIKESCWSMVGKVHAFNLRHSLYTKDRRR